MKSKKILFYLSLIFGIIVTFFYLVAFVPKFVSSIHSVMDIPGFFTKWYDDPTAFFLTYFIGYAIIWWKPLWGSVIIIFGCILFFVFNPLNTGFLTIFLLPTLLVAIFYILYWIVARKK
jgi:hypothetical protein